MKCEVKQGFSKKSGNEYIALEIEIVQGYKKLVFLDPAEVALVKMTYNF